MHVDANRYICTNIMYYYNIPTAQFVFMQVSYNGYIVLWPKKPAQRPVLPTVPPTVNLRVPFIAPFWANMSTSRTKKSHVLVRLVSGRKSSVARAVKVDIRKKFKINYTSKKLLIVSWLRVHYAAGLRDPEVRLGGL